MKNKIIGISGVAGAGKDLFYELLSTQVKCKRFSLGDELKKEIKSYCLEHFNIDPTNCSRTDKNLIRKCLVSHASIKRTLSEGRYWLEKVDTQIKNHVFSQMCSCSDTCQLMSFIERADPQIKNHVFSEILLTGSTEEYSCITDIRYNQYEKDEVYWLKEELKGVLVHISQFKIINSQKIFTPPANEDEASQDSILKDNADYIYECQFVEGPEEHVKKTLTNTVIKDFLKCIKK